MRHAYVTFAAVGLFLGCAGGANDGEATGEMPTVRGIAPSAAGGLPSVVFFEPVLGAGAPARAEPTVMDQFGLAFIPDLMVLRPGDQVEFRNSEDVAHNVRVVQVDRDSMLFNVVTPPGEPYRHRFDQLGEHAVACDIHPGMRAVILVATARYSVIAEDDGTFELPAMAAGRYKLSVWSRDPDRRLEQTVDLTGEQQDILIAPER